jgi:hypothetical protein
MTVNPSSKIFLRQCRIFLMHRCRNRFILKNRLKNSEKVNKIWSTKMEYKSIKFKVKYWILLEHKLLVSVLLNGSKFYDTRNNFDQRNLKIFFTWILRKSHTKYWTLVKFVSILEVLNQFFDKYVKHSLTNFIV